MQLEAKLVATAAAGIAAVACWRLSHDALETPPQFASGSGPSARWISAAYDQALERHRDIDTPELMRRLGIRPKSDANLGFDPRSVRYYDEIAQQLELTKDEQETFRRHGMVGIDVGRRLSMGSAYYAIYTSDLPVLVTSDSILHAFHRSFDTSLEMLEQGLLKPLLDTLLEGVHSELEGHADTSDSGLRESLGDVELYLSVARKLSEPNAAVPQTLADTDDVNAILKKIERLELEDPNGPCTEIYGGRRCIDYSQFRPRGHYTHSEALGKYFQAMMWLGRADLGWNLRQVDPQSGIVSHIDRERRNASVMALLMKSSGQLPKLGTMDSLVGLWVGRSDDVTVAKLLEALAHAKVGELGALARPGALDGVDRALDAVGAEGQSIRSQVVVSPRHSGPETKLPFEFQVFGQRFLLDSFVLSKVVYDSIAYEGRKEERLMPMGLDVMAALGNDEAVRLLEPELDEWNYGANLLAARTVVERFDEWDANVYHQWLGALRTLDDEPKSPHFPKVMKNGAWRRKQLEAQLGSWAELRHDTILYGKQSYTAYPDCEYPAGYVEPYPEFYQRVARMAASLSLGLKQRMETDPELAQNHALTQQVEFFATFAKTVQRLQVLAEKELRAEPFTGDEEQFLKQTIDARGGGSGPPTYDGWYPKLIFGDDPADWNPEVADVHTNPKEGTVLQVAVGDVGFVVVAIDNESDRAAYVGPIYSYYEFAHPANDRLTDEAWQEKIRRGETPEPPEWTKLFRHAPLERDPGRAR